MLLRRLVRVAKEQRITSISDFISSRYGKSAPLGTLVAVLVVAGMIPYIALQLKAVSTSFKLMIRARAPSSTVFDPTLLVAGDAGACSGSCSAPATSTSPSSRPGS